MELKASTQSPGISQDTNHTETEQAQAGYEEIRETPAIPDLPRIMPGYQDSLVNEGCSSRDRENFLCPTSGQQSNEDCLLTDCNSQLEEKFTTLPLTSITPVSQNCSFSRIEGASHMGLINPEQSNHASSDLSADMTQAIMSQTIQTNSLGFISQVSTGAKDQHSAGQIAVAERESAGHFAGNLEMCNSDLIASTTTELAKIEKVLEQTSVSIKQPDNREMFDCQGQTHDGTSYLSDKTFSHSNDTLSHGTIPLCQDRPGPKPPDLACCYPKKFRYKD